MTPSAALAGLPPVVFALVPALSTLLPPEESRADCTRCPMACDPEQLSTHTHGYRFHPDARCCTYHPLLANWMVGRALRAGGTAAAVIWARLQDPEGVEIEGIRPTERWSLDAASVERRFGRDLSIRCPYWVGGTHACGIWMHREGVCRTWFCHTEDGPRSEHFWRALKSLLNQVEYLLREQCTARGQPPTLPAAPEAMADWYRWCADEVDALDESVLAPLRDDTRLQGAVQLVLSRRARVGLPMPPRLGASVRGMMPTEDGQVEMSGYSGLDRVTLPMSIFRFLGRLDGTVDWQPAMDAANAELPPEEQLTPAQVERLYRRGILDVLHGPEDLEPGVRILQEDDTVLFRS